jgi:hypothetical protein
MSERITYSFEVALSISAVMGAIQETEAGDRIRIDPIEDWAIWRNGKLLPDAGGSEEACLAWLIEHGVPLERGWLPELPRSVASAESFVEGEDDEEV